MANIHNECCEGGATTERIFVAGDQAMAGLLRVLLLQAMAIALVMRTVLDLSIFGSSSSAASTDSVRYWSPESEPFAPPASYDRAVVVLIDALRADMLLERPEMRYTRALLRRSDPAVAAAYVTTAQTPTVTMPRIKAIVTGGIPSFADILHNFDSAALREDNLVRRLHAAGQRLVLLGDDTWLKLFPAEFGRSDGTPVCDQTLSHSDSSKKVQTSLIDF